MSHSPKFLILEDDQDIRFLHWHALTRAFQGCEIVEVTTCDEALVALAASPSFDAVISDHQLQGSTGADCIGLMRAKGLNCPILLVTSSDDPRVHQKALDAGATRVFTAEDTDFISFLRTTLQQKALSMAPNSEDFFQQLADGAPVMIWMSGLDMGCFYFNRAWLNFRGRTLEQEAGNGWAEGVHPEDMERCVNHYTGCFERRIAFAMSYRLQHHSGTFRWILDRGAPHYLPDGTFLGFFGGCAEIEVDTPIERHAELGATLAAMKEFARHMATDQAMATNISASEQAKRLTRFAQDAYETYAERQRRMDHATRELTQLADDMLAYRSIGRARMLPDRVIP